MMNTMRNILLGASFALLMWACGGESGQSAEANPNARDSAAVDSAASGAGAPASAMAFEHKHHDFGKLVEGVKICHDFTFANNGSEKIIIEAAKPSCSCTSGEIVNREVAPGEKGVIKVCIDTKGRQGVNNKFVSVKANTTPPITKLSIKAEVAAAEEK